MTFVRIAIGIIAFGLGLLPAVVAYQHLTAFQ